MRTGDSSRRAAVASLPSLFAIAAAFFLPFVKGCDAMISPLQFSLESVHKPIALAWVLPRFFVAALLAGWTLVLAWKRCAPHPRAERWAVVGLALSAAAFGVDWWVIFAEAHHGPWLGILAMSAATLASAGLLVGAWRRRGWARWERLIAAHATLSSPLCGVVVTAGSWKSVGAGGYAYVTSIFILLVLFLASRRGKDPTA
jgi:hypothetical protein